MRYFIMAITFLANCVFALWVWRTPISLIIGPMFGIASTCCVARATRHPNMKCAETSLNTHWRAALPKTALSIGVGWVAFVDTVVIVAPILSPSFGPGPLVTIGSVIVAGIVGIGAATYVAVREFVAL